MSIPLDYPRLLFSEPLDERARWETAARGYYSGATVEMENGTRYPVFFYDPVRLAQELQEGVRSGQPFIAEPGMIVVPEVTEEAMRAAIEQLHREGWFAHLKPLD